MENINWFKRLAVMLLIGWILFIGMFASESHSFNWSLFIFGGLGLPCFLGAIFWTISGFLETRMNKPVAHKNLDQQPTPQGVDYNIVSKDQPEEKKLPIWSRLLARTFDYYVFTAIAALSIGYLFPSFINNTKEPNLSILLFLSGVFLLTLTNVLTGTSLGKLLFGLQVMKEDKSRLSSFEALKREMLVWYRGYGLGIPLVCLFTLSRAHTTLKEDGKTSWDRDISSNVTQKPIGVFRLSFAMLVAFSFIGGINAYSKHVIRQELKAAKQNLWKNPITKKEVKLPKYWSVVENSEETSIVVSSFGNARLGHARLLREDFESEISLNKYAQALLLSKKLNKQDDYLFSEITNSTVNSEAIRSFSLRGSSLDGYMLKFHIWQDSRNPTVFWHALFTQKDDRTIASDSFESLLKSLLNSSMGPRQL